MDMTDARTWTCRIAEDHQPSQAAAYPWSLDQATAHDQAALRATRDGTHPRPRRRGLLERHGFVRVVAEHYATNGTERTFRATARRFEIRPQLLPGNDEIRTAPGRVRRGVVEW